jgi:hypothetical protein
MCWSQWVAVVPALTYKGIRRPSGQPGSQASKQPRTPRMSTEVDVDQDHGDLEAARDS